jgi:segregation and condensation protein B
VSRKKKSEAPPPESARQPVGSENPSDTIGPPPDMPFEDPHPTESGGMPAAPPAAGTTVWDEQPTVNLTGSEFDAPTKDDAAEARAAEREAAEAAAEDAEAGVEQARELTRAHLRGLLEALVFASDKPMKAIELARLASAPVKQVRELLAELKGTYASRGVVLDEIAGGWLFRTSVQYAPFVRELASERPVRLTRAQVETLAIAAYRQPITRPEIDDIRGVDSGATLKLLLERDLLRILGKKDEPGRPILYGTTTHFLEFFGLKSLKDLPTLKEFTELSDESRRVAEAELGDVLPDHAGPPASGDTLTPPEPPEHDTIAPPPPPPTQDEIDEPEPGAS